MIKCFLLIMGLMFSVLIAQEYDFSGKSTINTNKASISIGLLHGASLIGGDFEYLVSNNIGLQAGFGLLGFDIGLNYHFKPSIKSSYVSLSYWNIGIGDFSVVSLLCGSFNYRGKKGLTAQLGLGKVVNAGPLAYDTYDVIPSFMLIYSIGMYFPIL